MALLFCISVWSDLILRPISWNLRNISRFDLKAAPFWNFAINYVLHSAGPSLQSCLEYPPGKMLMDVAQSSCSSSSKRNLGSENNSTSSRLTRWRNCCAVLFTPQMFSCWPKGIGVTGWKEGRESWLCHHPKIDVAGLIPILVLPRKSAHQQAKSTWQHPSARVCRTLSVDQRWEK